MTLARVHNFGISLDGFGTGEGQSLEAPFGHAGTSLTSVHTAVGCACHDSSDASVASSISVHGGAIVLGKTPSATVTIGVLEAPGTEDRPLRLSVNVGAFSQPVRIGPGKYSATYVPPPERYPQVALVAVWKETGPDAQIFAPLGLQVQLFGGQNRVPVVPHAADGDGPRIAQVVAHNLHRL